MNPERATLDSKNGHSSAHSFWLIAVHTHILARCLAFLRLLLGLLPALMVSDLSKISAVSPHSIPKKHSYFSVSLIITERK